MENLQRQFSTKNFAENWKPNQTLWINVALNFSVRENIILCATSVCFKWQVLWYFWHDAVKFKLLFIFVTAWCWICHLKTSRGTLNAIYFPNLRQKLLSYFFAWKFLKIVAEKSCAIIENRTELCVEIRCVKICCAWQTKFTWYLKPENRTLSINVAFSFLSSENIILHLTAV